MGSILWIIINCNRNSSRRKHIQTSKSIIAQISKYKALGESAYNQYILPELDAVRYADIIDKISFVGELQLGASDFSMIENPMVLSSVQSSTNFYFGFGSTPEGFGKLVEKCSDEDTKDQFLRVVRTV